MYGPDLRRERGGGQVPFLADPEGDPVLQTGKLAMPAVVSRKLWKFSGVALRAFEGLFFQAARSRGIGSIG